ncbi:hypothetical protein BC830DRAFT_1138180 [Chytriomyces sp. MP71]|nr:hypothetical protein BC830DRAFT_1138180 [Chytriomyces sp. MP71]
MQINTPRTLAVIVQQNSAIRVRLFWKHEVRDKVDGHNASVIHCRNNMIRADSSGCDCVYGCGCLMESEFGLVIIGIFVSAVEREPRDGFERCGWGRREQRCEAATAHRENEHRVRHGNRKHALAHKRNKVHSVRSALH